MPAELLSALVEPMHSSDFWYGVFAYAAFRKEVRGIISNAFDKLGGASESEK